MKSNSWFQMVPKLVVLLAIVVLAACRPTSAATIDDFDYAKAADIHAARWQAMAEFYARHDLLTDNASEVDAEAARWQAITGFYVDGNERAAAAESARLQAVAGLYGNDDAKVAGAQAARWQAVAEYYGND